MKRVGKNKNSKFQLITPVIIALALASGVLIGAKMTDKGNRKPSLINSIHKFSNIMNYIKRDYVDTVNTEELVEVAITKMLEKLDPHSVYMSAEEVELSKPQLTGEFSGIGIEFNILRDTIYVVSPLNGGPSEKLGIRSGDRIITVDGKNVAGTGITNRGVVDALRGKRGTKVLVGIKRKSVSELLEFNIERDKIPQYSVDHYMVDEEVGYIKISRFAATTYVEFSKAMSDLTGKGMKKLILDLQGNPGGYMDRAIKIADDFLDDGKLVVYTKGQQSRYNNSFSAQGNGIFENGPIIVLIDEGSASASEIVSGALQDNDRALIVGRRSFGKGLVQMPIPLNDGSELRLTISRYYTPSGRSIQKSYEEGLDDYFNDRAIRFKQGEFFSADSIKMNDSLKYETLHGRAVYGGGGIMPDYFVPLDTMYNSTYASKLVYSNAMREFSIKFWEKNGKKIKKMSEEDFLKNYEVSDKMLEKLNKTAKDLKIEFNKEEFEKSKGFIKIRLKADIGRRAFGDPVFYKVINDLNEIYLHALKLFPEAEKLKN